MSHPVRVITIDNDPRRLDSLIGGLGGHDTGLLRVHFTGGSWTFPHVPTCGSSSRTFGSSVAPCPIRLRISR